MTGGQPQARKKTWGLDGHEGSESHSALHVCRTAAAVSYPHHSAASESLSPSESVTQPEDLGNSMILHGRDPAKIGALLVVSILYPCVMDGGLVGWLGTSNRTSLSNSDATSRLMEG